MVLSKVVERLVRLQNQGSSLVWDCFAALMEAFVRLKELQEEEDEEDEDEDAGDEDSEEDEDDDDDEVRDHLTFYFLLPTF